MFIHHFPDYINSAEKNDFKLDEPNEWFDDGEKNLIPRLVSFVFQK